ncbi:MAG: hypothetical protein FWH05_04675 [Oscillospiraceae bacterium]|nr:hypothetical protein [Oscillospiraceae bacterium]
MKYITGIHALNLNCSLETSGDWHQSAIQWDKPNMADTEGSIFGEYGIELCEHVPENEGIHYIANTLRALLDLMEKGNFAVAQGMRVNYIDNEKYTNELMNKALKLSGLKNWKEIDRFIESEYKLDWLNYKRSVGVC